MSLTDSASAAIETLTVGAVHLRPHIGFLPVPKGEKPRAIEHDQYFLHDTRTGKRIGIVNHAVGSTLCLLAWAPPEDVDGICRQLATGVEFWEWDGSAKKGFIVKPIPRDGDRWRVAMPPRPRRKQVVVERDLPIFDEHSRPVRVAETFEVYDGPDDGEEE